MIYGHLDNIRTANYQARALSYDRSVQMRLEGEVSERRGPLWPLAVVALSGGLVAFLALQTAATAATFVGIAALITALSLFALTRNVPPPRTGKRRIAADARGLSVDGELVVPHQSIRRAFVKDESDGSALVTVEAKGLGSARVIRVHSARIAQALADTLEQEPRDLAQFDALPPWAHRMRWLAIILTTSPWILFNLLRHLPALTLFLVAPLYALIALPLIVPQKITIGEDGVLLRWAGRRRFVSFGILRGARATPLGVILDLAGRDEGRTIEIRLSHRAEAETLRRTAMLERIAQGIEAHRALAPAEDEALLLRGERPLEAWIEEMSILGMGEEGGYRVMAIPRERLWSVLENPKANPSARQGAALALRAKLDEQDRTRLESVSQKSASPHLRVAIDAVTNAADTPKLRVALALLEEQEIIEEQARDGRLSLY
jgi:hypothetical protein